MTPVVAIVTDLPFWRTGRGDLARVAALHDHLAARTDVRIVATLVPDAGPPPPDRVRAAVVPASPDVAPAALHRSVRAVLEAIRPDAAIVEFARLSGLRGALPPRTMALLDLHNVYWAAARNWHRIPPPPPPRDAAVEIDSWRRFDRAIAISSTEAALVAAAIGTERTMCCPHPAVATRRAPFRATVRTIGTIAGNSEANVEGLRWLAAEVLPRLPPAMTLAVSGTIDPARLAGLGPRVRLGGPVPTVAEAHEGIDVFVNPAPYGTGMKVKSAEALAAGLPVVATPAGALGIEGAAGAGLTVATDAAAFAAAIQALGRDPDRRRAAAEAAAAFARETLSPARCFAPLMAALGLDP